MGKQKVNTSPLWRFLFLIYCAVMLWLLFGRSNGWVDGVPYETLLKQNANLIPFYTINNYWHVLRNSQNDYLVTHCFINLAGNIILFIPAGCLFPKLWPKTRNYFRFFALSASAIFLVEILQLFTLLGSFDIDDLILNLFGMSLGFVFFTLFARKRKGK